MKTKSCFVLRSVAGSNIVVPVGDRALDFNGMLTLNETGAFIWNLMQNDITEPEIVDALLKEYNVDRPTAESTLHSFLGKLTEIDCIE